MNKKEKEYDHLAVSPETKKRFDLLRLKISGKELKDLTQDDMIIILMNNFEENEK